jgi:hypothetical protein
MSLHQTHQPNSLQPDADKSKIEYIELDKIYTPSELVAITNIPEKLGMTSGFIYKDDHKRIINVAYGRRVANWDIYHNAGCDTFVPVLRKEKAEKGDKFIPPYILHTPGLTDFPKTGHPIPQLTRVCRAMIAAHNEGLISQVYMVVGNPGTRFITNMVVRALKGEHILIGVGKMDQAMELIDKSSKNRNTLNGKIDDQL